MASNDALSLYIWVKNVRNEERIGCADMVRGNFLELRIFLECGRSFTFIFCGNITHFGNILLSIWPIYSLNDDYNDKYSYYMECRDTFLGKF